MFGKFFSYESRFFQIMVLISKWMLLNFIYLICCIPLITIGAAGAGMMNAARVIQDPDDDSSCVQAYFRGFTSGFWKITAIWSVLLIFIGAMLYILFAVIYFDAILHDAPVISAAVILAVCLLYQTMAIAFHSRFDCSIRQILRNTGFMILMHPIRALGMTLLLWTPVILALLDLNLFFRCTPVWMFVYYGAAYQGCAKLIKKPFMEVENHLFHAEQINADLEMGIDPSEENCAGKNID